jgi:peroxiredoxin (alkyl hydroperoxide reductase subunit C)
MTDRGISIGTGSAAPDFTLKEQNNQPLSLSAFRGRKNVVIVFFPLAFARVCQGELDCVRDRLPRFQNADTELLAVSVAAPPSHKIWSAAQGYIFPLLSDFWPHGEVARRYGVFDQRSGLAHRGTFVVDRGGIVRFAEINPPARPRDPARWQQVLARLPRDRRVTTAVR